MSYLLDTHVHTIISSACGHASPSEIVQFYLDHGFNGIVVTDHFYLGNTSVSRNLPWDAWVRGYCNAYREVKKAGDAAGLDVFFGWESTFAAEDFLVYGLDEEWLSGHPEVVTWDQKAQYENVKAAGGFVVQPHPFRERTYMNEIKIHPYHADAWEIANAGNEPYMDRIAKLYAEKYDLPVTAGSDLHRVVGGDSEAPFGMEFDEPIKSMEDLKAAIVSGSGYRIVTSPDRFTREKKNPYFRVFLYDKEHKRTEISNEIYPDVAHAAPPTRG